MSRSETVIRKTIGFFQSSEGKATIGLFGGVLCFCFPHVPGYAIGGFALYYGIHQFRPVAAWLYQDIRADLDDGMQADGGGD